MASRKSKKAKIEPEVEEEEEQEQEEDTDKKEDEEAEEEAVEEISYPELEAIQKKIIDIDDQRNDKIYEINKEYEKKKKPFYQERSQIASQINQFWLKTLQHHSLGNLLTKDDKKVFEFLSKIDIDELDEDMSFRLTMTFKENIWFSNTELWKEFRFESKEGEKELHVNHSEIQWKEGKNLLVKPPKEPENSKKKRKKPADEDEEAEDEDDKSFFSYFTSENPPEDDLEIGNMFKEELWPDPVKYFTGTVDDEERESEEEEEEEENEEENEDENDADANDDEK